MELRPYQREGIQFVEDHKKVYLAFDMGLGKTLTALAAAASLARNNVLVIAELNEVENSQNFRKELANNFAGQFMYRNLRESPIPEPRQVGGNVRYVCVINPDALVKQNIEELAAVFDFVIIDEATFAKTTTTKRFKIVKKICDVMKYVVLLSGTPMLNGASEIYAPLLLIGHELAGNGTQKAREAFEAIFAGGHKRKVKNTGKYWLDYAWWAKGANNLRELRFMIDNRFVFISKGNSNLFKKKLRRIEWVSVGMEWLAEYNQAWQEYMTETKERFKNLSDAKFKAKMENITELQRLIENGKVYQINSAWKAPVVVNDIKTGKYGNQRIIIFTMFVDTYERICTILKYAGISYKTFDEVDEWKAGNEQVLVGRIKAHGKGGNLPQASVTLFVDMDFVPLNNMQAENRMDRPEQTRDMEVVYYMAEGDDMVDAHIRGINQDKMKKIEEFTRALEPGEVTQERLNMLIAKFPKEFRELEKKQ